MKHEGLNKAAISCRFAWIMKEAFIDSRGGCSKSDVVAKVQLYRTDFCTGVARWAPSL